MTTIDVSAQFGGLDAHQALLAHFHALKRALKGRSFDGFPLSQLAFVLRVDGSINTFGLSGAGNIEIDKHGKWVSVDIGITLKDWSAREPVEVATFISTTVVSSVALLREQGGRRLAGTDWRKLDNALQTFCAAYLSECRSLSDPHHQ